LSISVCKYFLFLSVILISSCVQTNTDSNEQQAEELVSHFELDADEFRHIFVVSQYQCLGCVDSIFRILNSVNFAPALESSFWISPNAKPEYLTNFEVGHWEVAEQNVIEQYFPYAGNITYFKLGSAGVSEYQELGIDILERDELKKLLD
jgi:hypothetical protein